MKRVKRSNNIRFLESDSLRACLKIETGPAAADFAGGQKAARPAHPPVSAVVPQSATMAATEGESSAASTCEYGGNRLARMTPAAFRLITSLAAAEPFSFSWGRRPG